MSTFRAGAVTVGLACGWLVATVRGDSVVPGSDYSFHLQTLVGGQQRLVAGSAVGEFGHGALAHVQVGEPAFLRVSLSNGGLTTQVGLDGATFAESSLEVMFKRGGAFRLRTDWDWDPKANPLVQRPEGASPRPAAMMGMPGRSPPGGSRVRTGRSVSLVLWFHPEAHENPDTAEGAAAAPAAPEGSGRAGTPRRLLLDQPGLYPVLARVPHLLVPEGPRGKPQWSWRTAQREAFVQVHEPDLQVTALAADVAAVISADHVVPPEHRPMLEKHAVQEHRVARWAEWLLLRSFVADPAWRAALAEGDADALAAFKQHEPAARRFLAELKWRDTPPWYEAKLFLAAEFAARGEADLAETGLADVFAEYVGGRTAWEAGKPRAGDAEPASTRPARRTLTIRRVDDDHNHDAKPKK